MGKKRKISEYIRQVADSHKVIVFTGARQTGKTTLAKDFFHGYTYISIEDPVMRKNYTQLSSAQWKNSFPRAILDEIQKEPVLVESIKAVYDQFPETHYVMTGSSQFLLLEKVRESLAGRCYIFELYPFTLPEMQTKSFEDAVPDSLFQKCLRNSSSKETIHKNISEILPSFLLDANYASKSAAWDFYKKFGAYPALMDEKRTDEERYLWLKNYVSTYLERDIRDLASFRDLEPFVRLQQYLALQTGQTVNTSSIARQIGVSSKTVQRYITYFQISYQVITLQPWTKNENKRLVKSPKIHYLDNGILQTVLLKRGGITGAEFESLVIAEIYKQTKALNSDARFYYLRTLDGFEVDLLIETQEGYFAFEIKMAEHISKTDAGNLLKVGNFLDKPLLHSFLVSNDTNTQSFGENCTTINAAYLLG
ncbi:MAG: ATP-binding protein [Treponema sp.]|nr:ATP-binding protein [Treponema sp.]